MLRACFLFVFSVLHVTAYAGDVKRSLVALELPGLTDTQKKGEFANLYSALEAEGILSHWEPAPVLRAHQVFVSKQASCLAPTSMRTMNEYKVDRADLAEPVPFNRVLGYLFEASDYVLQQGERPSLGTVGIGFMFGVEQDAYEIVNVATYEQLIYLVHHSRLSAVYVNYPDVLVDAKAMKSLKEFKGNLELRWDSEDTIICWKEHVNVRDKIAESINKWQKTGHLKQLLGKYYIDLSSEETKLIP